MAAQGAVAGTSGQTALQRIQRIEEKIIASIELAAAATEQLSSIGNVDKAAVTGLCEAFMQNIQQSQALVQEALANPVINKTFEASSYHAQARAQIAVEKVSTVAGYLSDMSLALEKQDDGSASAVGMEVEEQQHEEHDSATA